MNKYLLAGAAAAALGYYYYNKADFEQYPFEGTKDQFRSLITSYHDRVNAGRDIYIAQHGSAEGVDEHLGIALKELDRMKKTYSQRYGTEWPN